MAEQEPHAEQGSVQHTSNVETSFDELAKGLTNGTLSRRKALRMFGAALVGGMLASIPGVAWAARPEDAPRYSFCSSVSFSGPSLVFVSLVAAPPTVARAKHGTRTPSWHQLGPGLHGG